MARDLGDFQTPLALVGGVLDAIGPVGERWPNVLEPTCGSGSFIRGLIESQSPPREIKGFEIQDFHFARARRVAESSNLTKVSIKKANIFGLDLKRSVKWRERGPLLVIGNPPWITNSELSVLESANLPPKSNLKKLTGIDAITGGSNFDIAEFIWLKLIEELADQHPAIAMLCKTSVARNVLQFARDKQIPVSNAWVRRIDARKYFDAAVDACLFYLEASASESLHEIPVFETLRSPEPETVWGFSEGRLVVDIKAHRKTAFIDGRCSLTWRQGVKHDASQVMELREDGNLYRNRLGEAVDVESDYIYPLLKSRDLNNGDNRMHRLSVIIPQRRIGEETGNLEFAAPKLWDYLSEHDSVFERRKSTIYRGRPRFSIFGIGDYSFAPFKVAVSGFYKDPRFRFIAPVNRRPVMLDDTCYFIACQYPEQAAFITALLNHQTALDFLRSVMFRDAKRPITKRLLQRIDLIALLDYIKGEEILLAAENELRRLNKAMPVESAHRLSDLRALLQYCS